MRKVICFIVFVLLVLLTIYLSLPAITSNQIINLNKDKLGITVLKIDKINLKEMVYEDTIKSKSIKGVVLFKEFGRPNKNNTNTIIGAHSGDGVYSIFTDLDKIGIDDVAYLSYKNISYKYKVINKFLVKENNNKILNNITNKTTLTLFTCNEKNDKYRLIIVFELIDFI